METPFFNAGLTELAELLHTQQGVKVSSLVTAIYSLNEPATSTRLLQVSPLLYVCQWATAAAAVSGTLGIAFSEAIMFLRVYALSGGSRRVGWFLSLHFLSINISKIALLGKFISSVQCESFISTMRQFN
ncbi:hypothetical protein MD484_g6835, partial [Candolleomyces efflorescens]